MPRLSFPSFGTLPLEPRLVAAAAMADMPAAAPGMSDAGTESGVTGVTAERVGAGLLLRVDVSDRCPACLLRVGGVIRAAGNGALRARFPVAAEARTLVVEMTDAAGEFRPVWTVRFGPDGRVVAQSPVPDDATADMGGMAMSTMAMGGMPEQMTSVDSMTGAMAAAVMTVHRSAMPMPAMSAMPMSGFGRPMPMNPAAPAMAGHEAEETDPFAEPEADGHGGRMRAEARVLISPALDEEAPAPPPAIVDVPVTAVPTPAAMPDVAEQPTEVREPLWPIAGGGTAVTFLLLAASREVERQSKRTHKEPARGTPGPRRVAKVGPRRKVLVEV